MLLLDMLRIKTSIKNTPKRLKLKENFILIMFGAFRIETDVEEPGRRYIGFGGRGGSFGQMGTSQGIALGDHIYGKRQFNSAYPVGSVGQHGTNSGSVAVGYQHLGRR